MKNFIYKNGGYILFILAIIAVVYLRIAHPELNWKD